MATAQKGLLAVLVSVLLLTACVGSRNVTGYRPQLLNISGATATDSAIIAIIAPYHAQLSTQMSRVIGENTREMAREKVESALGNFVADLFLQEASQTFHISADASLLTIGGLRAPLPKGKITVGDIFELSPFENEMVLLSVNGKILQQILDILATDQKAAVGNIRFIIQNQRAVNITVNGFPLEEQQTYQIITYDYLANGGDKLSPLIEAEKRQDLGITVRDLIIRHIERLQQEGKKIDAKLDGRVQIR